MIECATPQDILKYKAKFIANFTAREVVCLGLGASAGLISFFTFLSGLEKMPRMYISVLFILPFFAFGFIKPFDMPLEKVLIQVVYDNFICPPIRKNETRFPEYERYKRNPMELNEGSDSSDENQNKKETAKKNQTNTVKKITKSKEYKAIR